MENRYSYLASPTNQLLLTTPPAVALDIATLHIINALAVNDTVGAVISRESLENGIARSLIRI